MYDVTTFQPQYLPDLIQGSQEWLEWRKGIPDTDGAFPITGTDAPCILGRSKFATPDMLWRRKLGLAPAPYVTPAMIRGNNLEPEARALYEQTYGDIFTPCCIAVKQLPWLRCSLDGLSFAGDENLEIKCPNEETHQLALQGRVPLMYWIQMQHQLMCSGAKRCWYWSYDGRQGAPRIEVLPDYAFMQEMLAEEIAFREHLLNGTHPEGEDWLAIASRYAMLSTEYEELGAHLELMRAELFSLVGNKKTRSGSGVRATKSVIAGKTDYKAFLMNRLGLYELSQEDLLSAYAKNHGIDLSIADTLDEYRKKDTTAFRVSVSKNPELEAYCREVEGSALASAEAVVDHGAPGMFCF